MNTELASGAVRRTGGGSCEHTHRRRSSRPATGSLAEQCRIYPLLAVWTIFAIIGVQIKAELGLSETQFGILVATPILTGSLIRLLLGIWTEQ
jgi:hypothetical protein